MESGSRNARMEIFGLRPSTSHRLTRILTLVIPLTRLSARQDKFPGSSNVSFPGPRSTSTIRENWIHACYSSYWVSRYARYPNSSNPVCQPGLTPALAHGTLASLKGNALTMQSSSQSSNFCTSLYTEQQRRKFRGISSTCYCLVLFLIYLISLIYFLLYIYFFNIYIL